MDIATRAIVRNQLYLRRMNMKDLAEAINDNYSMTRQVLSGNITHKRIEKKILDYMGITDDETSSNETSSNETSSNETSSTM